MSERENLLERQLPNSAQTERALLGAVILDNTLAAEAVDALTVDDFYARAHQLVFRALAALYAAGQPIDPVLVAEELRRNGQLEQAGGTVALNDLLHGLPHISTLAPYVRILKDKAGKRRRIKDANLTVAENLEDEEADVVLQERAEQRLYAIGDEQAQGQSGLERADALTGSALEAIEAQAAAGAQQVTGVPSGFADVDDYTLGFQPTDLILIAGRPAMGKTAFALNLARHAAGAGLVVALFSLEMSKQALVRRLLSSEARVDAQRMRRGYLNHDELEKLRVARTAMAGQHLLIDDTPGLSPLRLRAKARRCRAEHGRLDLIVVDYIGLMGKDPDDHFQSREERVAARAGSLKATAKELNVPVVALSQLNRNPEGRGDHRPQLADLRESGSLEQDADVVMFLYREEVYSRAEELAGVAEVVVAKQRNGPTGIVKLAWSREYTRFENLWDNSQHNP